MACHHAGLSTQTSGCLSMIFRSSSWATLKTMSIGYYCYSTSIMQDVSLVGGWRWALFAHIHTYACAHVHACTHTLTHTHTNTYPPTRPRTHAHAHTHTRLPTHSPLHMRAHTHTHTHIHTHMHTHTRPPIPAHTHTHTHTHQDGVPDEEDGRVVPHQVPVPVLSIQLHSEPPGVTHRVRTARLPTCRHTLPTTINSYLSNSLPPTKLVLHDNASLK